MFKSSVYAVIVCCFCISLYAEQVTLKNGDRLTGAILSVSDKKLTIKTEHAGTVTIDWDAVAEFSSGQPMVVTRTDKQVVSGAVTTKDSEVAVSTTSGTQTIPMTDVAVMRSPADQAAYEKSLHPGMLEGWAGGGNLGLALGQRQLRHHQPGVRLQRRASDDHRQVDDSGGLDLLHQHHRQHQLHHGQRPGRLHPLRSQPDQEAGLRLACLPGRTITPRTSTCASVPAAVSAFTRSPAR